MAVIGCDIPVRQVVGAEALSDKGGVWTKTLFRQDGPYLVATTYIVAKGNPTVFEMKVDLRPLEQVARKIHERLHQKAQVSGVPGVGGFSFAKAFKSIKNTAKKIGRSKLVKAVGNVTKAIVKPLGGVAAGALAIFPPTAAIGIPALAAFGAANAAIKAVGRGKKLTSTVNRAQKQIATAQKIQVKLPQAKAALTVKAKAAVATKNPAGVAHAKKIAVAVKKTEAKAKPIVLKAAALQKRLADPKVRAQLTSIKAQADSAKAALASVALASHNATTPAEKLDAQKSRAIVNLVAHNQAHIDAVAAKNAGGLPALLIDAKGRITRGRYAIVPKAAPSGAQRDILYLGPGNTQAGLFSRVSGAIGNLFSGTSPPPRPRPRPKTRDQVIREWLMEQRRKGKIAGVPGVGVCIPVPRQRPRVSGEYEVIGKLPAAVIGCAPGRIGCDCGTEF